MYHLALETSTRIGSICLLQGQQPLETVRLAASQTTTAGLVAELARLVKSHGLVPSDIRLVSVSIGPGSFTGLRVGVTVAKTFAWATGCPVAAIGTHEIIARQAFDALSSSDRAFSSAIISVINAQRHEWFAEIRRCATVGSENVLENRIVAPRPFVQELDLPMWISGPGLSALRGAAPSEWNDRIRVCEAAVWQPRGDTTGILGHAALEVGQTVDHWALNPVYGRRSAAEEKLDADRSPGSSEDALPDPSSGSLL